MCFAAAACHVSKQAMPETCQFCVVCKLIVISASDTYETRTEDIGSTCSKDNTLSTDIWLLSIQYEFLSSKQHDKLAFYDMISVNW